MRSSYNDLRQRSRAGQSSCVFFLAFIFVFEDAIAICIFWMMLLGAAVLSWLCEGSMRSTGAHILCRTPVYPMLPRIIRHSSLSFIRRCHWFHHCPPLYK